MRRIILCSHRSRVLTSQLGIWRRWWWGVVKVIIIYGDSDGGVVCTLSMGHLPNTFCFISPTNLLHFPNKLLRFPNKIMNFPNKCCISPMQCCVTLPKNEIIKIQTSAHQNPDICSLHSGKLTVVIWRWWCWTRRLMWRSSRRLTRRWRKYKVISSTHPQFTFTF